MRSVAGGIVGIPVLPVAPIVVLEVIAFVIVNFVPRGHHRISGLSLFAWEHDGGGDSELRPVVLPDAEDVQTDLLGESRSPP